MSTIKDVAKLSGVSPSTVSIVLNGNSAKRNISEKTQKKVMDAVKKLNYHPNIAARKLRSKDSRSKPTIALYWSSDISVNIMSRFLRGLYSELTKSDNDYNVVICPYKTNCLHLEKGIQSENSFDAAIIANVSNCDLEYLNNTSLNLPIILFNRLSKKYSSVNVNNYNMGKIAADLFNKNGHKKVGAILTKSLNLSMANRNKGFIETCKNYGIELSEDYIIGSDNSIKGGAYAAKEFLKLKNTPKALFCNSDSIALGVINVLNKEKINVPDDIELIAIGMTDNDYTEFSNPSITIVDIPIEKMAEGSIKLISDLLNGKIYNPTSLTFDAPLIIRESCK
ncbi:LacI family DNA-binding transcriptional regulator [Clostridium felsineum]|uniref:LacI family DNA-binding transcriptional regulator n=1 Tax=Clostridium felsineum TaxID=36839 RepID=UPI00098C82AC|nr:LacI family DNA-binding transcriptional regulator [Clostridium felsineum]